jgi:hypothetical protein
MATQIAKAKQGEETNHIESDQSPLPKLAYSMEETSQVLGVSYITVHRLLKRGLLRSSSALRHKLIPITEIERFLRVTTK